MAISYRNGLSIAELAVFAPALVVAILLGFRHGFGKSSGWYFLILLSLARIIGSSMELATINDPANVSLYTGAAVLQTIGISPLILATLGLLNRVMSDVQEKGHTIVQPRILRLLQLLLLVALILGIVGGIQGSDDSSKTGKYTPQTASKVGIILYIVAFIALVGILVLSSGSISKVSPGEKRILLAVAASLPFILVRIIYSVMSTIANNPSFNAFSGNVTILLCMADIEEWVVVIIYLAVGLTLSKKIQAPSGQPNESAPKPQHSTEYPDAKRHEHQAW